MSKLATIVWLGVAACSVGVWAITQQYRAIPIIAAAEDDCAYFYGAYALDEVTPGLTDTNVRYVTCWYRN